MPSIGKKKAYGRRNLRILQVKRMKQPSGRFAISPCKINEAMIKCFLIKLEQLQCKEVEYPEWFN
jgi:hypothetical protein